MMKVSNPWYGFLLNLPGLLVVLLWVVFPAGLLLFTSFLHYDNMSPITFTGFGNYREVFEDRLFWMSLKQVAVFSIGTTLFTFIGGMVLALGLKGITKGAGLLRSLMIMPWAVPAVVSGIIWKWMFSPDFGVISDLMMKVGLIDAPLSIYSDFNLAMLGVIIADSWTRIPFMGVILLAALISVPQELYEVAKIDGAGSIARFVHISLPLIRGPMLVGLLITVMFSFRTIDIIIPLTAGGPGRATYVFGYYIWDQIIKTLNFGMAAAAGIILFLITGCISVVFFYFSRSSD
ncbi:ABC transporter permease subunit [candidate division KSB3 bacterium]|uniref:ABC transporter permease subunit n=1 Tax=candidate division KSB3 bacterium TaxID=2044937 RepID=A0A9D5JS78_9BACT|nr:ABC transporter permease subunit [candidate division KSB3 bacterium]MBD3323044.1 ABC transporter permease subunit [candidate division KSB3 bacterium]